MDKLALVTGGSGYFGDLLVSKLLEHDYKVRVFDLLDVDDRKPGVEFVQGDIRDLDAVKRACEGVTVAHHNVAQVPLAKDKELFWSVNQGGTENLLKAAIGQQVGKVVYTSSSAVFGVPTELPVTEETKPVPAEAYGEAKLAGEKLCFEAREQGLDVSIVRPRTIMGHGRLGIMQILFEWIREGYNVPVFDSGDNRYQFVHAEDMADACRLAGERAGPGIYNIGTDRFSTMRETLEALVEHAGTGSRVKSVSSKPAVLGMKVTSALGLSPLGAYHALMYGKNMWFDCTRANEELGWQPRFSNEEMFIQSYDWYLQNRDSVLSQSGGSHHRSAVKQGVLKLIPRLI